MQTAVMGDGVSIQTVYLEEWGYDERFRGGEIEVLNILFQFAVASMHGGG